MPFYFTQSITLPSTCFISMFYFTLCSDVSPTLTDFAS